MTRLLLLLVMFTSPLAAQQLDPNNSDGDNGGFTLQPELNLDEPTEDELLLGTIEEVQQQKAVTASGAVLRALDRVSGVLTDLEVPSGNTVEHGRLRVALDQCRYPEGNPSGDAFGYLKIYNQAELQPVFEGWMIASSPALNALDHPRYDVWVLRCITS